LRKSSLTAPLGLLSRLVAAVFWMSLFWLLFYPQSEEDGVILLTAWVNSEPEFAEFPSISRNQKCGLTSGKLT